MSDAFNESQPSFPPPPPPPPPAAGMPAGYVPYSAAGAANYATWGKRVMAYFLRSIIFAPANILVRAVDGGGAGGVAVILSIAVFIFSIGYQIRSYIQRGHLGYDWADSQAGIAIRRESTGAPMGSGWSIFGRNIAHIADALPCLLGFLWPLWDKKRQTFADKICGTVSVENVARHSQRDLLINSLKLWEPVIKN
jgi:uncharacterized RDD family membrane protein YckC